MIQIDFFVLLAQILNFAILYAIFKFFIADKLNTALEERKLQLEKLKNADAFYQSQVELAKQYKQELLTQAQQTNKELRAQSEQVAKKRAQEIIVQAKSRALSVLDGGKRELEKERKSMLKQVKSHIIDTSLRLNEKMFQSKNVNREFLEKEFEKLR